MAKYGSKYAAFQAVVRDPIPTYEAGVKIAELKPLVAEFGTFGNTFHAITQSPESGLDENLEHVDIRGFYCDTEVQGAQKGWTDQERRLVEARLDFLCETTPDTVWRITAAKLVAPWPTYEDTHHNQIPVLAETLGMVEPALAYERQREKPRESVIAKLEEILVKSQQAEELTAA